MRTNELHACAKQVKRSSGRSSVAAAAYRSGERIVDERTGLIHDYRQKGGIEHTALYLPGDAPEDFRERAKLWNAVEFKENRKNSTTAHELEIAFPHEFNVMQRREAGDMISKEIMRRYNCAVDIAYHHPNREGDQRNFHAHILFTTRGFDSSTKDGWAKNKYRDLAADIIEVEGDSTTRGRSEIQSLRKFTADQMNHIAERDGLGVKTEHLSFEARGIDKQPTQKMGWFATQLERRGIRTERGDLNRAIRAANDNMGQTTAQLTSQRKILLLEQSRALLALEQEEGSDAFTGSRVTDLGSGGFPFHQKKVEEAKRDLDKAKDRLENISMMDKLRGKRALFESDIQHKERMYASAQRELHEIVNDIKDIEPMEEGSVKQILDDHELDRARAAQEYKQDLEESKAIRWELEQRTNTQKIIGAITGRAREQNKRLEQLQANIRFYEAEKRREELTKKQLEQHQRDKEKAKLDQTCSNDNEDEAPKTKRPERELTIEEKKQEFLDRMAKEREKETQEKESEIKKAEEPSEDEKVERSKEDNAAARKEEFLQRMKEERSLDKPRDKGDIERE